MAHKYSAQEVGILRSLFDQVDLDRAGKIHVNQLPGLCAKLGKTQGSSRLYLCCDFLRSFAHLLAIHLTDELLRIAEAGARASEEQDGQLMFDQFVAVLESCESAAEVPFEGPDPKVLEFLRILEEYRLKCEEEGNYLEAGRAYKQLSVLRKQEEKRQQKAIKARQISERQDVQLAHNMQFSDFNSAWDKYMEEYDTMAQMYIQQMTERHAMVLLEFQKQLRAEIAARPPRWSHDLMETRRRQHVNARNKNYAEAQKLKKQCDQIEEKERREMEQGQSVIFARKEAKYRQQQQAELQALLKRIECRRKEHIKQRNLDSKRLLQRNRNVQAVLESKQAMESQRLFDEIKKTLDTNGNYLSASMGGPNGMGGGSSKGVVRQASRAAGLDGGASVGGSVNYLPGKDADISFAPPDFASEKANFNAMVSGDDEDREES
jgi:hypothetical protein